VVRAWRRQSRPRYEFPSSKQQGSARRAVFTPLRPVPAAFSQRAAGGPRLDSRDRVRRFPDLAHRRGRAVRDFTRNGHNFADRFARIGEAVEALPVRSCVIDGEAIVCDDGGLAVFELIRDKEKQNIAEFGSKLPASASSELRASSRCDNGGGDGRARGPVTGPRDGRRIAPANSDDGLSASLSAPPREQATPRENQAERAGA
jgi:hypothetical protein